MSPSRSFSASASPNCKKYGDWVEDHTVNGKPLTLLQDILEYKQERKRRRLETVDELANDSQRMGLY
jgi:hypothetical protein